MDEQRHSDTHTGCLPGKSAGETRGYAGFRYANAR